VKDDEKPSQTGSVIRTSFEAGSVAVTQWVHGCYCEPARGRRLWRAILNRDARPMKDTERWNKWSGSFVKRSVMARRLASKTPAMPNAPLACEAKAA
jgi:hypothetical protein